MDVDPCLTPVHGVVKSQKYYLCLLYHKGKCSTSPYFSLDSSIRFVMSNTLNEECVSCTFYALCRTAYKIMKIYIFCNVLLRLWRGNKMQMKWTEAKTDWPFFAGTHYVNVVVSECTSSCSQYATLFQAV